MSETQMGLLNIRQVREVTTLSTSAIYDRVARGTFPAPLKISARRVAWRMDEVQNWIKNLTLQN